MSKYNVSVMLCCHQMKIGGGIYDINIIFIVDLKINNDLYYAL